tara:strand:- start:1095 stop:2993 length:1899 start_codon:yes stop_codon:yes gene_type:complete
MAEAKHLNTTELDPKQIKTNLIEYFKREDSPYKDWDFEGSGLDLLVTVLANNTHMNAVLASVAFNESFIDSAQLRKNVVSRAKLLGYVPRSRTASAANVDLTFIASSTLTNAEKLENLILPRGTEFTAETSDATLNFITLSDYSASYENDGRYRFNDTNGNSVQLRQGVLKSQSFIYDASVIKPKFVITDANIDTDALVVTVKKNEIEDSAGATFVEFNDIAETDSTAAVYFIQENSQGVFELEFGDGVLGQQLQNLNQIEIEYLSTEGAAGNNVNEFFFASGAFPMTDGTNPIISTNAHGAGGSDIESVQAVRFNAPNSLITQDRAVTAKDYQNLISENFGAIEAINVWGGEDEVEFNPDDFHLYAGKVYISIKPTYGDVLTVTDKTAIQTMLNKKRVFTIRSYFVDPEFTRIGLNVSITYQANKTSSSLTGLIEATKAVVGEYEETSVKNFEGVFRESNLLTAIDSSDDAIISSDVVTTLYKDSTIGTVHPATSFFISFGARLASSGNSSDPYVTSTNFASVNSPSLFQYVRDVADVDLQVTTRPLEIWDAITKTTTGIVVGVLDTAIGKVTIFGTNYASPSPNDYVTTVDDTVITYNATPYYSDLYPDRNNILDIDLSILTVTATEDNA